MPRNYQKENEWNKTKYSRLLADLDKELVAEFKDKLNINNLSYSEWLRQQIQNYLKK